jgi:16S rRNA (uracil1498-N3)-methyltransferase
MKLQRFFVKEKLGDLKIGEGFFVSDEEMENQLRRVFRFRGGEVIELFDGSGFDFQSEIRDFKLKGIDFILVSKKKNKNVPKTEIHLFQSIIKKDNFEWIVEKGTELGVTTFHPIISDRSEKKDLNLERLNKIAKEASEQSGRGEVPEIFAPATFSDAIKSFDGKLIAFDQDGLDISAKISGFKNLRKIGILIGPEGGWSEGDLQTLKNAKVEIVSLGKQTLRAETASIVASTIFLIL